MQEQRVCSQYGMVKLYGVDVFSYSNAVFDEFDLNVGSEFDHIYFKDGVHPVERDAMGAFRWTSGSTRVELPLKRTDGPFLFTIECIVPAVVETLSLDTQFYVDDSVVSAQSVSRKDFDNHVVTFTFESELSDLPAKDSVTLGIVTPTWVPRERIGVNDTRKLGIQLKAIRARRVNKPSNS